MYIQRDIDPVLLEWKNSSRRKPLLLRGVRQCGKTRTVRHLAEQFENYAEINLEKQPSLHSLFSGDIDAKKIVSSQRIKIKLEIDTDNPAGGKTENKYRMLPSPYEVQVFDEPTLFAGKIHAILCREYKHNVKGRDYYDYLFYAGRNTAINIKYLENKLKNTGKISNDVILNLDMVKRMLEDKFKAVDYEMAKADVAPFIDDKNSLMFWKTELFISTVNKLKAE